MHVAIVTENVLQSTLNAHNKNLLIAFSSSEVQQFISGIIIS